MKTGRLTNIDGVEFRKYQSYESNLSPQNEIDTNGFVLASPTDYTTHSYPRKEWLINELLFFFPSKMIELNPRLKMTGGKKCGVKLRLLNRVVCGEPG